MAFPNGPAGAPHEFADPETAGHADIERDNNEVHRRIVFLTLLDPAHADRPGLGVTLNNNIAHVQNVANRVRERENAVNAPRPLTEIPVAGGAHNLNGVRSQHICKFTGTSKKPEDLYSWLGQVMQCAIGHDLDHACVLLLLYQTSQGAPNVYVEQLRAQGLPLVEVVQALEIRYGELCSPEAAVVKLQTCKPEQGAPLHDFIDTLTKYARIVSRNIADPDTRLAQVEHLVRDNLVRGLPFDVRIEYERQMKQNRLYGRAQPTVRQMESEISVIEAQLTEINRESEKAKKAHGHGHGHRHGLDQARHHRPAYAVEVVQDEGREEANDGDLSEPESEEDPMEYLINQAVAVQDKYQKGNRQVPRERILQGAAKRFNRKFPGRQKVAEITQAQAAGPPSRLPDAEVRRKSIYELLKIANVPMGHCIQCGLPGHRLRQDACAMKDKKLADRSCLRCGQGLHSQDECTKPLNVVSQLQDLSLNDE